MRLLGTGVWGIVLLSIGFLLGSQKIPSAQNLRAEAPGQETPEATSSPVGTQGISPETQEKIKAAYESLQSAAEALKKEGFYQAATSEVNVFGVLSGGLNAIADLKSGNGVDPETFAAIYAGTASREVQEYLQRDESNRYTYDGKLVQMYPVSELRRRFVIRARLTGQLPEGQNGSSPKKEPEPEKKPEPAPANKESK